MSQKVTNFKDNFKLLFVILSSMSIFLIALFASTVAITGVWLLGKLRDKMDQPEVPKDTTYFVDDQGRLWRKEWDKPLRVRKMEDVV